METRLYKRDDFPLGGNGEEISGTRDYHPEAGNNDIHVYTEARPVCSGGRVAAHFCFHVSEKQSSSQEPGVVDIHNESCRLEWRTRRTGQAVEISLGRVFGVYNSFFTKNPFPAPLCTFVSRKRKRGKKRKNSPPFSRSTAEQSDRGTPLYIYIYTYTFPSLFAAGEKKITSEWERLKRSERFHIISLMPFMDNNYKAWKIAGETSAPPGAAGLVVGGNLFLTRE